jgi:sugar/nucleoside kinase (ribokinase family)
VYALADLLYVSPDEYEVLSGRPYGDRRREAPLPGPRPPGATVIVKRRDEITVRDVAGVAVARVPCTDRTSAVDPTGAGDAVAAGVLAAHSVGGSVVDGCRLGLWIAAHRVSHQGDGGHRHLPAAPEAFPWLAVGGGR